MGKIYHLGLNEEKIKGARFAILPGDPERVLIIAKKFSPTSAFLQRRLAFMVVCEFIQSLFCVVTNLDFLKNEPDK